MATKPKNNSKIGQATNEFPATWSKATKMALEALPDYLTIRQIENAGIAKGKHIRHAIADPTQSLTAIKVGERRPGTTRDNRRIRIAKSVLINWLHPTGC